MNEKLFQGYRGSPRRPHRAHRRSNSLPHHQPAGGRLSARAEYIAARLKKRGFGIEFIRAEGTPGDTDRFPRVNVVARFDGRSHGPTVHFNSHIDVVEAGDGWTVDPFAGVVKDGKVFGRGACDMKGGLAASIIAVEAFMDVDPDFPGAIEISGTVDEESGGFGGRLSGGQGLLPKPKVDHVIIPEPLNKDRICLGHRGVWWAEIQTKGESPMAQCRFSATVRCVTWAPCFTPSRKSFSPPSTASRPECLSFPKARGVRPSISTPSMAARPMIIPACPAQCAELCAG